jgi:hypothetical protein
LEIGNWKRENGKGKNEEWEKGRGYERERMEKV